MKIFLRANCPWPCWNVCSKYKNKLKGEGRGGEHRKKEKKREGEGGERRGKGRGRCTYQSCPTYRLECPSACHLRLPCLRRPPHAGSWPCACQSPQSSSFCTPPGSLQNLVPRCSTHSRAPVQRRMRRGCVRTVMQE